MVDEDKFSFQFPEMDFKDFEDIEDTEEPKCSDAISKIHEYLDKDMEDQLILISKLKEFEQELDKIEKLK